MTVDELKAAVILFFSLLDEKQRRLYAGLEAVRIGHGGDRRVAELLGVDVHQWSEQTATLPHDSKLACNILWGDELLIGLFESPQEFLSVFRRISIDPCPRGQGTCKGQPLLASIGSRFAPAPLRFPPFPGPFPLGERRMSVSRRLRRPSIM